MRNLLTAAATLAVAAMASPAIATTTVNYTAIFPNDPTTGLTQTHSGSFDYDFAGGVLSITNATFNNGVTDITSGTLLSIFPGANGFVTIGNATEPHGTNAYQLLMGFNSLTGTFLTGPNIAGNDQAQYSTSDPAAASHITPFTTGSIAANFSFTTTPAAVPEPATWAMMLVGFGGMGFAMRRKRGTPTLAQIA